MHPMEIDLILTLRHEYRFGEVGISMRDGLPQQLLKTVNRRKLGDFIVVHNVDLTRKYPDLYNKLSK